MARAQTVQATQPSLQLHGIGRTFRQAGQSLEVLRDVSFSAQPGEMIALMGPSGAGKSTLLQLVGLLESPSRGRIAIHGQDCTTLSDHERTLLRRRSLGFVYQAHRLLPDFSARENVMLPMLIAGHARAQAYARAGELLEAVGLSDRQSHRPARLSGGEQQRVAIARALANRPQLILADEPTGNLDSTTAQSVFELLEKLARTHGVTAVVATHNPDMAARMDRTLQLRDGTLHQA
jgi:lipoprotein-releasing system ATP-binding protein